MSQSQCMIVLIRGDMATAAVAAVLVAAPPPAYGPVGLGLTRWTYEQLIKEVLLNHTTTVQWCLDVGLLARSMTCHGCGEEMRWEATTEAKTDGYR